MGRFWRKGRAGGRPAGNSSQPANDNEPEASADGTREARLPSDGLMTAVVHKSSSQAPYKVGFLSPIEESPFEGQGAVTSSLASALFTSNSKFINSPSAVGRAGGPEAPDADPPERGQSLPGLNKNRTLRLLELPVYGDSFRAPSSRFLEESSSLAVAPKTPLLSPLSRASLAPIPAVPRSFLFSDDANLEYADGGGAPDAPTGRRRRRVKSVLKGLPRRIRSTLLHTWGGTVYGMFSEDDLRAFENSMTGFPPYFLDSRMEAQFMCVHSKRVTCYYVALICFWIIFLTIVFGSFLSRVKQFRVVWILPYVVGMSTALILTVAYLALVGVVALRMRPLKRKQQREQGEGSAHAAAGEGAVGGGQQDDLSAKAATEWRESAKLRVYHLRWVILRDVVISAILVLNIASWAVTYIVVGFATLMNQDLHEESLTYLVSFYLREDIFTVFCFFVIFHLACPIRVQTHWLVFALSLCFFWTNGILLSIAMHDAATVVPETIMVTIVLGFACALRATIERMHRFAFFLRQRSKGIEDAADETMRGLRAFSTTPVEELILLVNAAGLKLRTARKQLRYRKPNELVEAEGMLMRRGFPRNPDVCLMILTARDDLFAFVVDEAGGEHEDLRNEVLTAFGATVAFRTVFKDDPQKPNIKKLAKKDSSFVAKSSNYTESNGPNLELPPITSVFASSPLDLWHFADDGGRDDAQNEKEAKAVTKGKRAYMAGLMAVLPQPPIPRLLANFSARISIEWDLNMLEVNNFCNNCCLFYVGHDLLHYKIEGFPCSNQIVINFLWVVQLMYQPTMYHGHMHGAQVAHNVLWLARTLNLTDILTPPELVSLTVAALCHDVGHQGRNNAFYTMTNHPLSIIYNDVAVLENFHACLTFKILQRTECDIFQELDPAERMACRCHIIDLILATDMKLHFENVSKFKLRRSSPDFDKTHGDDVWQTLRMCMKGGDLSHALLPWEAHLAWSYLAISEFYQQGDDDLAAGRDVIPMFDRRKHAEFPKGQAGFIRFVVWPLFEEIAAVCPDNAVAASCLARAEENLLNWHKAETEPEGFLVEDQKQQETLRIQMALLATQKAVNRRLGCRVSGYVQIVSPERGNGGAEAASASSCGQDTSKQQPPHPEDKGQSREQQQAAVGDAHSEVRSSSAPQGEAPKREAAEEASSSKPQEQTGRADPQARPSAVPADSASNAAAGGGAASSTGAAKSSALPGPLGSYFTAIESKVKE
ncbi:hypothetical protein Esti_004082 [Eimeria stiedai]